MTLAKSLLSLLAALAFATGTAFADESMPRSSLETTDDAYSMESQPVVIDPEHEVYYIVPREVVEVEEVWLVPQE
jgi:hypothetical protein